METRDAVRSADYDKPVAPEIRQVLRNATGPLTYGQLRGDVLIEDALVRATKRKVDRDDTLRFVLKKPGMGWVLDGTRYRLEGNTP